MYFSIPEIFYCSIKYVKKSILEINSALCIRECCHKSIKIGAVLPCREKGRWIKIKDSMEREAEIKGVNIRAEFSNWDINKEIAIIKRMILAGIDVLVLASVNLKGENKILAEVHKAGIKIIAQDALINNAPIDLFVGFNMLKAGELQGNFLTKRVPKGRYVILSGEPNGGLLKKGAMEYINPLIYTGKVQVVADEVVEEWLPENAYRIMKKIMIKDKNFDAVLAPVDDIAGVVIKALSEENLQEKVVVTGQDADFKAIKRILEGTQAMTLLNDAIKLGELTIDLAINLIEGKSINYDYIINNGMMDVPSILIDPILIDKTNVYSEIKEAGYYKEYFL